MLLLRVWPLTPALSPLAGRGSSILPKAIFHERCGPLLCAVVPSPRTSGERARVRGQAQGYGIEELS